MQASLFQSNATEPQETSAEISQIQNMSASPLCDTANCTIHLNGSGERPRRKEAYAEDCDHKQRHLKNVPIKTFLTNKGVNLT